MGSFTLLLACIEALGSEVPQEGSEDTLSQDSEVQDSGTEDSGTEDTGTEAPDYSQAGPFSHQTSSGSSSMATGCNLNYRVVSPSNPTGRALLAHGFMRSGDNMMGWAEHLASWGLEVWVPDLCWSGGFNADPEKNAQDIAELMGTGPVALAGHSAGALAVLLADHQLQVKALVGLDPVEQMGQDNSSVGAAVQTPTLSIFGEPGSCNSDNSGVSFYGAVPGVLLLDLQGADHCDFESPTDGLCEALCTANDGAWTDEERRDALAALVTSWLLQEHTEQILGGILASGVTAER